MYNVNIMVFGPEGEDLGYQRVCDKEELEKLLRTYDRSELLIEEIPEAKSSISGMTCFCPNCMRMYNIDAKHKDKKVMICDECKKMFVVM